MKVTVFTPTYNRAYVLPNLFASLCQQTCKDFEWLIIDDGSSDNTEEIVQGWLHETSFSIRYFKQKNGGKHRAINRGAQEAHGEFFFIVDSDDTLSNVAIERVVYHCESIKNQKSFAGVCGLRAYKDGTRIGGECDFDILDCSPLEFRVKYGISGDMAEVVNTDILKEYPFPDIPGEMFCTEALLWDRLSAKYKFRYFYEKIYICEYLNDGLTASMTRIRKNSPQYAKLYYSERYFTQLPFKEKAKAAINYWRFAFCDKNHNHLHLFALNQGLVFLPIGFLFYLIDKRLH